MEKRNKHLTKENKEQEINCRQHTCATSSESFVIKGNSVIARRHGSKRNITACMVVGVEGGEEKADNRVQRGDNHRAKS